VILTRAMDEPLVTKVGSEEFKLDLQAQSGNSKSGKLGGSSVTQNIDRSMPEQEMKVVVVIMSI